MAPDDPQGLRPKLARAQETLQSALEDACNADLGDADTGELIRIEEVLAIANEAAKEAVSVRRRLGRARELEDESSSSSHAPREIQDGVGVRWVVFAVYPSTATTERSPLREPYTKGWLAFDCGMETRRLAPIPEGWSELADAELVALCTRAEVAPRRKGRGPTT